MIERETKYLVPGWLNVEKVVARIQSDLSETGYAFQLVRVGRQQDCYLDSAAKDLRHAGWSLRIRRRARGRSITLKSHASGGPGGDAFQREEFTQRLYGKDQVPTAGRMAECLRALLPSSVHSLQDLQTQVCQTTRRTSWLVCDRADQSIALWCVDEVQVLSQPGTRYVEVEFEYLTEEYTDLGSIVNDTARALGLVPSRLSKYERGTRWLDSQGAGDSLRADAVDPAAGSQNLAHRQLTQHLNALVYWEPVAWEGLDIEGVHRMRVCARKLQSTLLLWGGGREDAESARLSVKDLTRRLGAVRDLDVHRQKISEHLSSRESVDHDDYVRRIDVEYAEARSDLRRVLRQDYPAVIAALRKVREAFARVEVSGGSSSAWQSVLLSEVRNAVAAGRSAFASANPTSHHALRKRLRNLRYQLEDVAAIAPGAERLADAAKVLQNLLGTIQDLRVSNRKLKRFLTDGGARNGEELRAWRRRNRRAARKQRALLYDAWLAFEREAHQFESASANASTK